MRASTLLWVLPLLATAVEATVDRDGDGFRVEDGDCNDADAAVYPTATESCDGLDNDCDGELDERLRCPRACTEPVLLATPGLMHSGEWAVGRELVWTGAEFGVFIDESVSHFISFRRADSAGQPIGPMRLNPDSFSSILSDSLWTGSQYGELWAATYLAEGPGLAFQRFDGEGSPLAPYVTLALGADQPTVAWTGSEFGVAYVRGSHALYFQRLDPLGQMIDDPVVIVASPPNGDSHSTPRLAWTGSGFGIAWRMVTPTNPPQSATYFMRLAPDGTPIGTPTAISASPTLWGPALIWTGSSFDVFVETRGLANEPLGRLVRLLPDGSLAGPPVVLPGLPRAVGWDGLGYAMAHYGTNGDIVITKLDAAGFPTTAPIVQPVDGTWTLNVGLTWTGSTFGVLWTEGPLGEDQVLRLSILGCACVDDDEDGFSGCEECDDTDARIYPGAPQACDGVNNDCLDPDWPSLENRPEDVDNDGDGLDECGGDCDDDRATVFPGAAQLCDGVNNDCNDATWPAVTGEQDADGDGHPVCDDCSDSDPMVYPGAVQACDGVNNDCNDPTWPAVSTAELDQDGDGFRGCQGDCADLDAARTPIAPETCNGVDDDCDASVDEDELGQDTDDDGVYNLCDNCRDVANAQQSDDDSDRVGDACDNCPFAHNSAQTDADGDAEGDVCDWDDGAPYLLFETAEGARWEPEIAYFAWNVYRGDLAELRAGGAYTQSPGSNALAERWCELSDTTLHDDSTPDPGACAFYLLAGSPEGEDSLGTDSTGTPRPNAHPCP